MSPPLLNQCDYAVFVPEEMWGGALNSVLEQCDIAFTHRISMPIGRNPRKKTESIVTKAIEEARVEWAAHRVPILILPVTLMLHYDDSIRKEKEPERIVMLAPAFKSRDDIYLFLGRDRRRPAKHPETNKPGLDVLCKGEHITSTVLLRLYASMVIGAGCDPMYGKAMPEQEFPWGYELRDYQPGGGSSVNRIRSLRRGRIHGFVEAGASLGTYWNHAECFAAVNLNSWICARYATRYFVRAVFCTLPEVLDAADGKDKLLQFWQTFGALGLPWANRVKSDCRRAHRMCIGGHVRSPVHAPAVIGCESDANNDPIDNGDAHPPQLTHELASDLTSAIRFLAEARALTDELQRETKPPTYCEFRLVGEHVKWAALCEYHSAAVDSYIINSIIRPAERPNRTAKEISKELAFYRQDLLPAFRAASWNTTTPTLELVDMTGLGSRLATLFLNILEQKRPKQLARYDSDRLAAKFEGCKLTAKPKFTLDLIRDQHTAASGSPAFP